MKYTCKISAELSAHNVVLFLLLFSPPTFACLCYFERRVMQIGMPISYLNERTVVKVIVIN